MPSILDVNAYPSMEEIGFTAGRESFRDLCKRIFASPEPRFLRDERNQLVIFRNADLQAFGSAPEVGNVPIGVLYPNRYKETDDPEVKLPGWEIGEVIGKQIFTYNPPLHAPARRIVTSWLGPKQVSLMEGIARRIARDIVDGIVDGEEVDFVPAIAERLIIEFWGRLLNLTLEETVSIGDCARDMTHLFHTNRTSEDFRVLDAAFARYSQILSVAADRGLAASDPTMVDIAAKIKVLDFEDDPYESGIVPKTVGAVLAGNLIDGVHTVALAAANTFYTLIEHPEALAAVRETPEMLPKAIAEALRLEPPVLFLSRYVLRDFHHGEIIIPAKSVVTMLWAAGNHDPDAFPRPQAFELGRPQVGFTTFGGGIHICPGRYVAVMLIRVLIEEFEASHIVCEAGSTSSEWYPAHKMGQLKRMPVRLSKAAT